ncbi:U3 small nucleolar RNA-associated protein 25 [Lentithecium fluviatile CBS 122367]|uniref:U3 small nucleolar RNA-associated protein 25 n=1 Tax=Lentithecium fluviatile CBS 122367 TaxID=1168545 RepID=A0A6G1JPG8_9PLEO|nr:U3 small nucleolar RNA-associated protein 25 [Lentithecium fluviatile CBS 122367]
MRGRGRGGARGGRKNAFAPARIEDPADARGEYPSEPEISSDSSDASSAEDEEEALPTSKAYHSLLQSLANRHTANTAKGEPRRKRRKLDHSPFPDVESEIEVDAEEESDSGEELDLEPADVGEQEEPVSDVESVHDEEEQQRELNDAFEAHFERPDENELAMRLKAISENQWTTKKLEAAGGRCLLQVPSADEKALSRRRLKSPRDVRLKPRLVEKAQKALGVFNAVEQSIAPSLFEYQDVLFGARTPKNAGRLRDMASLHALNHILKTRDRVLKNNSKLAAASDDVDAEYRDQGFTRPKILFLLETKQACVRVVDSITRLHDFEQQENKKRFLDSFSLPEDKFSDDKPDDFRELFEGNDENEFRVGVKLTRKTLKLYSTFYNSDIILASALGLRRAIESNEKKKDYDFLSSIEMVIMEQADATLMQNWEHAEFVFEHLNLQPKETHGCDFSRVRNWYLDGHAPYVRQTIIFSAFLTPKINTLYNKHMRNVTGRLKYTADYTSGIIESLAYGIKQTFSRFDSPSHLTDPDSRFKYFSSTVLPQITRFPKPPQGGIGVLVYVPSYLDFVRVRNSLVDSDLSYASISEYTDLTDVRKARSHFMSGRHSLLLYTGRAHHFHRYHIRGVKRVVFYGVPENPRFYDEVVGFIGKTVERGEVSRAEGSVRVCFSKWERLELERIVGSKRVGKMVGDRGDVFDFI